MRASRIALFLIVLITTFSSGYGSNKKALNPTKKTIVIDATDFGVSTKSGINNTVILYNALEKLKEQYTDGQKIVLSFPKGTYHFASDKATERTYYISNHDQDNPKQVGIVLEHFNNLTLEGNGSTLLFHGRMLPISLIGSTNCTLQNFSIDFVDPKLSQCEIIENKGDEGMVFKVAPVVASRIGKNGRFEIYGEGWAHQPSAGIVFDKKSRHNVEQTSDIFYDTKELKKLSDDTYYAPYWKDKKLKPSMIIAMRTWFRPTPGIFMADDINTSLKNIQVHFAEGMGLLAQMCENIDMDGFSVCLKGDNDIRYFTTQADATHFSGCKGHIHSVGGLYEGMMDDAINVHGTYLKIQQQIDRYTVEAAYMHSQCYGFRWGEEGDEVQFITSETMEYLPAHNRIVAITPIDAPTTKGAKTFRIQLAEALPENWNIEKGIGIENLTWTPSVYFANNTIRNNRARGALFSTPRKVVVEKNLFDHTSGTAILLCGDCNGWYETGACRDVVIRKNTFINALTNMYQFTNAIISIYPEIPNLKAQKNYFHGGKKQAIQIVDNTFETFDAPIVYAKSVDGLVFTHNRIKKTTDYNPFHWNKKAFLFERVVNYSIKKNKFDMPYTPALDLKVVD